MTLRRRDVVLDQEPCERLLDVISRNPTGLRTRSTTSSGRAGLEAGRLELAAGAFDPRRLAERSWRPRARTSRPASSSASAADSVPNVAADSDKARQVLANLLDNVNTPRRWHGRDPPGVRGRQLRFAVRDEGLGIPLAEQSRIFEQFYRLDPNLTRGVGGTGLGLIRRELVRHMGGRIWVASAEGEGSTFFEPCSPRTPSPTGTRGAPGRRSSSGSILAAVVVGDAILRRGGGRPAATAPRRTGLSAPERLSASERLGVTLWDRRAPVRDRPPRGRLPGQR